jgi:hypothetical protein
LHRDLQADENAQRGRKQKEKRSRQSGGAFRFAEHPFASIDPDDLKAALVAVAGRTPPSFYEASFRSAATFLIECSSERIRGLHLRAQCRDDQHRDTRWRAPPASICRKLRDILIARVSARASGDFSARHPARTTPDSLRLRGIPSSSDGEMRWAWRRSPIFSQSQLLPV